MRRPTFHTCISGQTVNGGSGVNHLGGRASSRLASAVVVLMMGHSLSLVSLRYACKRLGLADAFAEFLSLFPARKEGLSDKGAACASGREASTFACYGTCFHRGCVRGTPSRLQRAPAASRRSNSTGGSCLSSLLWEGTRPSNNPTLETLNLVQWG